MEYIVENPSCPYLYLAHNGWQDDILHKIDKLYDSFGNHCDGTEIDGLSYFELMEDFISIMKILYKNIPNVHHVMKRESSELTSLRNMITYVEEHYMEHMTLNDIAAAGACCKSRCSLLFKKYLRDTPISYITKFRLKKSLVALLESDSCITDIVYEYGFGGASYYCETFRKYYGVSPLKYKKEKHAFIK